MNIPFLIFNFVLLIISGALIMKATELFVKGTVDISTVLRLPKVFVGVTLVSLVTTAPEFVVSVSASLMGDSGIAVGNAIGSVICNMGLVFSIGIMIKEVMVHKEDVIYKVAFLLGVTLIMGFFIFDGVLSRLEAAILLILLIVFFVINYRLAMKHRADIPRIATPKKDGSILKKGIVWFVLGGVATVLLARFGLLSAGLNIANILKLPHIVIGLTLIAIGTSLPELFVAIVSGRKDHSEIAFGNVIGANILNLLFVLGAAALINPLTIDRQTIYFSLPVMIVFTAIASLMGLIGKIYNWRKGVVLLGMYIIFLILLLAFMYR